MSCSKDLARHLVSRGLLSMNASVILGSVDFVSNTQYCEWTELDSYMGKYENFLDNLENTSKQGYTLVLDFFFFRECEKELTPTAALDAVSFFYCKYLVSVTKPDIWISSIWWFIVTSVIILLRKWSFLLSRSTYVNILVHLHACSDAQHCLHLSSYSHLDGAQQLQLTYAY